MNLFDQLVAAALQNNPNLANLRIVVEKELLHHDILRILSQHNLLKSLTFIGGTCLRACYGNVRLSEDLDFTGGKAFSHTQLAELKTLLINNLYEKYGLEVNVSEPVKDIKNVDTWKIKIETRPEHKHVPAQRINIDICRIDSYEKQPILLLNPYGVDMGTHGLIIQAQSREEIYTDKLLAFALRPNRLKHRDLWDILWLHQQGIKPNLVFIANKLQDRDIGLNEFLTQFQQRQALLANEQRLALEFEHEMQRFLPLQIIQQTLKQKNFWAVIVYLTADLLKQLEAYYR